MKWTDILKNNFRKWEPLADFLQLNESQKSLILKKSNFILNLPLRLAQKIEKSTLDDPILKQFLPILEEEKPIQIFHLLLLKKTDSFFHNNYFKNTLAGPYSSPHKPVPCTAGTVLDAILITNKETSVLKKKSKSSKKNPTLSEVILSGGDPLSLQNKYLKKLLRALSEISHLKLIRWHTRFPIGIPERIDSEFLNILEESPLQQVFVIHCNHFKELDTENVEALKKFKNSAYQY